MNKSVSFLLATCAFAFFVNSPSFGQSSNASSTDEKAPVNRQSVFQMEIAKIATNPDAVNFEIYRVVRRIINGLEITNSQASAFMRISKKDRDKITIESIYLAAFKRALLLHNNDVRLTDILNQTNSNFDNLNEIVDKFEAKFFETYSIYPSLSPINSNAILERLLRQN